MIDVHIDDFYHDIAVVLLSLFQQFPRKINLFVEDVSGADEVDEFGLHSPRHLSCVGAMMWLQDEGYIRYEDMAREESIEAATLTQVAFTRLIRPQKSMTPDDSEVELSESVKHQRSTLAFQLHEAVKERDSIKIRALVEQYFMLD